MRTKFFLLMMLIFTVSCRSENHYHDGYYEGSVSFVKISWNIDGNEIQINNSITGVSKLRCRQYPDRIEYQEDDGTTRILYAQENGDLQLSDLIVFKKVVANKEEISSLPNTNNGRKNSSHRNQMLTFDLSNDSYSEESAIIKEINVVENEVYIVVDMVQIEYSNYDDENYSPNNYRLVNENSKLRMYRVLPNASTIDSQCLEISLKYLIQNKDKIKTISPLGFVLITTNKKGELTELNLGCWN